MSLYALPVSRDLRNASSRRHYLKLPTPFQMSLLVGILLATAAQLRTYLWYLLFRKQRPSIPPLLHRASLMMLLSFLLAGGVFIADTILHYTTSTIEFDQIVVPAKPNQQLGRGLSEFCLTYNRTVGGTPCSVEITTDFKDPSYNFEQTESRRLLHNISQISEIQTASAEEVQNAEVAYLAHRQQTVTIGTDYHASTIGVSTECKLVNPSTCAMTVWGPNDIYTNFSCSDMFHGTLGKTPNPTEADGFRPPDPYRSYLMYKPAANLMYSFFNDAHMKTIYNTVSYNDSNNYDPNLSPLTDAQLVNPFFLGLAGRVSKNAFASGSEVLQPSETFQGSENGFLDFILNCAVVSYDVSYIWADGGLKNISAVPTNNGSVLEIFHGSVMYYSVAGDDHTLQDFMNQAPLAGQTKKLFFAGLGACTAPKY